MICQDYNNLDWTSKMDSMFESIEFRTIITQIILEAMNASRQELLEELHEVTEKSLNETILNMEWYDSMEYDSMENFKIDTTLLAKLNSELADKNSILTQLNKELSKHQR